MTARNRNIAWPSWVVFLIGCEKACADLLGGAATALQYLVTALLGCINCQRGFIIGGRGLKPADPWLGERDFHCNTCHQACTFCFWGKSFHSALCLYCHVHVQDCLWVDLSENNFSLCKLQDYFSHTHFTLVWLTDTLCEQCQQKVN